MLPLKLRNALISVFVVAWLVLFHYESLRAHYLDPFFGRELPKVRFLFPPAGWIMFFNVDDSEVRAEVYGQNGSGLPEPLDPHRIFPNRWIGYDNIRRNVMISVAQPYYGEAFCRYLKRKFPQYDSFSVFQVIYPSNTRTPGKRIMQLVYQC